jgi:hypothetical protein
MASVPKRGLFFNKVPVVKATADNIRAFGEESTDLTTLSATSQGVDLAGESAVGDRQVKVPAVAKVPSFAQAKAKVPSFAQAKAVAKAVPVLPEIKEAPSKDLSAYSEELQDIAIDILGEDEGNPYKDKTARPIFPIQTRLGFQKQILKVYSSFIKIPEIGKEPDYDACKKLGASAQQALEVYEYQKFVREYVRQASPYRGLLVYHGLGSGKTCSAIAAAEALFSVSKKRIIVMTPFSLRDNFIREVSFCGFRHFRLQNYWVKLDKSNPTISLFATEILGIPADFVKKAPSLWVPDFGEGKVPNFNALDTADRQQIVKQVTAQVTSRIEFINYNGITASKLKELACRPLDANGNGPFDNAVIVVDEIHNLTRLMQGTIEPYLTSLPGLKRKVPLEPVTPGHWEPALCKKATDPRRPYLTNYKRGYLLYRLLQGARNSKIIGLSGTPLINFPEEIAILINLLGGYVHTSSFTVTPASEKNKRIVQELLIENPYVDFEEVRMEGLNMYVMITCLPEGMIKVQGPEGLGIQRVGPDTVTPTIKENTANVIAAITAKGLQIKGEATFKSEPLLPPIGQEFRDNFLEADGTTLKNKVVLRKRIQGLISYYRGSKKELMPAVTKDELVRVPFTPYAQSEYLRVRGEELKQQEEKKKQKPVGGVAGAAAAGKMGNLWAELYELAKMKSPNSYRMFSRQTCNFAFPEGITRPRPSNQRDVVAEIGADTEIVDAEVPLTVALPDIPLGEEEGEAENAAAKEDAEIDEGEKGAFIEEAKEAGDQAAAEEAEAEGDTVLIKELDAVVGAPLAGAVMPTGQAKGKTLTAMNVMMQQRAKLGEECKKGLAPGEDYLFATARAKKCLKSFANTRLRLYAPGISIATAAAAGTPSDPTRLQKYSPKYAKILENVLQAPGSSLVYSQFLDMEGIGIFLVVLDINEFQPIKIESADGNLRFTKETLQSLKKGPSVNRYLSFTGGEDRDIRSMALKVFNAKFSDASFPELPKEMSDALVAAGFTGNLKGELCRVFCITSAGAEGLSLRNVRRVHIMEPYWNPVRTDQVKGRAVRICSHIDLELEERNVEVFTYCSVFNDEALVHPDGSTGFPRIDMTVLGGDGMKPADAVKAGFTVPEGAKDYVVTSDEYLYSLSQNKKKLLQNIQDLMKTGAVDCQINEYENEEDGLGCIAIPGTPEKYAFHPLLQKDIAETSTKFKEEDLGAADAKLASAAAAAGEAPIAQAQAQAQAQAPAPAQAQPQAVKKKKTMSAFVFTYGGKKYLAVPVMGRGGSATSFDIFGEGDRKRLKKLGTMIADAEGNPTNDIVMF